MLSRDAETSLAELPAKSTRCTAFLVALDPLKKAFYSWPARSGRFVLFRESTVKRFASNLREKRRIGHFS